MLIDFVGYEVVEVLSVVCMVCVMPTDIPTDPGGGCGVWRRWRSKQWCNNC